MAAKVIDTISKNHLECCICQDRYQDPKILDCLHSFCEPCLEKYRTSKYQGATRIPCPVCKRETQLPETGIKGLKANFFLVSLADEIASQEKIARSDNTNVICDVCHDEIEALDRCLDCEQNICTDCLKVHRQLVASSNHSVVSLEQIRLGEVELKQRLQKSHAKCRVHKGEVARFFCTTCEQLICRDCTVVDHCKPQHNYLDYNIASSTFKQSLSKLISPLEKKLEEIDVCKTTVSSMKYELICTVDKTCAAVKDRCNQLRAEVTVQEDHLIDSIKILQDNRNQQILDCEKALTDLSKRIESSVGIAKDVTITASDTDFLSLYSTISKDIKLLNSYTLPKLDPGLSYLTFKPGQQVADVNCGRLEPKDLESCKEPKTNYILKLRWIAISVLVVLFAVVITALYKYRSQQSQSDDNYFRWLRKLLP